MNRPVFLSKSKLMSARQCLKRLHLEVHRPELKDVSAETQAAFRKGNEVGDVARRIYGNERSVFIPYEGGLQHALAKSTRLLKSAEPATVFEATVQYNGVLVRTDVLIPDAGGWRMVEVKASTSVNPEHSFDCAIQAWVFRRSGYTLTNVSLAHIDNTFVYQGDSNFSGLLVEEDLNEDVEALVPSVAEWVTDARAAVSGDEPDIAVGMQCFAPYECPFVKHCWPFDVEYPILQLGGSARKAMLGTLVAEGIADVRDIPTERLSDTQSRIQRISRSGKAELLPGAGSFVANLKFPRYYIDFETVAPAVPFWAGTVPYQPLPFQWSCHFESSPREIAHSDFLDLSGDFPVRRFAESLIRTVGDQGPILVYSAYEKRIINDCIERFPDLESALLPVIERLVDLLPVTRENYYHPAMRGSWSIKAVLPTIAPDLNYDDLPEIHDGTAASEGFLEAINPDTDDDRKAALKHELLDYCRIDTEAMVRLVRFFSGDSTA